MSTPGATRSGLSAPDLVSGPVAENDARPSSLSTAPTVSAEAAAPGEEMVSGPALPAAITNRGPYWAERASTSWDNGSLPSDGVVSPRLMLTTLAPDWAAHSIPAITQESCPKPSTPPSTLPTMRCAPGATPREKPSPQEPVTTSCRASCAP